MNRKALQATLKIVLPYLLFGVVWIFVSDSVLEAVVGPDPVSLQRYQTLKGWFYVALTTLLLFALTYSLLRQILRLRELDEETGLLHRTQFLQNLDDMSSRERGQHEILLVLFDIDGFSALASQQGGKKTTALIEHVGAHLLGSFTADTLIGRLGSDDFALAIPLDSPEEAAEPLAVALAARRRLLEPFAAAGVDATASGGAALFPRDGRTASVLLAAATRALHSARSRGTARLGFYSDRLTSADRKREDLADELRSAIRNDELTVVYQPQVDAATRELRGCEALVRWERADGKAITPDHFVPLAAQYDLARALTELVLRHVVADLTEAGLCDGALPRVSINLSPEEFGSPGLVDWFTTQVRPFADSALRLQVEITEYTALANLRRSQHLIEALKARGVGVSLDDFGTGYSSLAALKDLPVDELKIDRTFVADLEAHPRSLAIIAAITRLAHGFGLRTVVEGVETAEQLQQCSEAGCQELQGFFIARPMRAAALAALLRSGSWPPPAASTPGRDPA